MLVHQMVMQSHVITTDLLMVLLQKQIVQPWLSPVVWSYILQLSRVYP